MYSYFTFSAVCLYAVLPACFPLHDTHDDVACDRSGRMGRELCISLTSVVLEAINTVEQAKLQSRQSSPAKPSPQQQQQQKQWGSNSSDSSADQADKPPQEQQSAPVERKRPSSERLSRGSPLAVGSDGGEGEGRARADSVGMLPVRRVVKGESVAGTAGVAKVFHKEDPGLKDLDRREEEFRKVSIVCIPVHATSEQVGATAVICISSFVCM